jgi:hypothetical protein
MQRITVYTRGGHILEFFAERFTYREEPGKDWLRYDWQDVPGKPGLTTLHAPAVEALVIEDVDDHGIPRPTSIHRPNRLNTR